MLTENRNIGVEVKFKESVFGFNLSSLTAMVAWYDWADNVSGNTITKDIYGIEQERPRSFLWHVIDASNDSVNATILKICNDWWFGMLCIKWLVMMVLMEKLAFGEHVVSFGL